MTYNTTFEDSRYYFEATRLDGKRSLSGKSALGLVTLAELVAGYVHGVPSRH